MAVVALKLPRGTYGLVGIAGSYFRDNIAMCGLMMQWTCDVTQLLCSYNKYEGMFMGVMNSAGTLKPHINPWMYLNVPSFEPQSK